MIRSLVIIAVTGFLMSVVCISAAIAIGGPALLSHGSWSMGPDGWRWMGHGHGWSTHMVFDDADQPHAERTLAWSGGDALQVEIPADVRFTQAEGPASLVVRGPKAAVDHVVVDGGRIRFDAPVDVGGELTVELSAPKVTRFDLAGSGRLDIRNYRQDALTLDLAGSGDVTAEGVAKTVQATISGSGEADLARLQVDGAAVTISGSGDAKVGPKSWAKLDISGSGDITLTSRPPKVDSRVTGSGEVEQQGASPTVSRAPGAGPARPA